MSRFTPYYKQKGPGKPGKSTFVSAEQSYGSAEHAKWLFERNMRLLSLEIQDEIKQVQDKKSAEACIAKFT